MKKKKNNFNMKKNNFNIEDDIIPVHLSKTIKVISAVIEDHFQYIANKLKNFKDLTEDELRFFNIYFDKLSSPYKQKIENLKSLKQLIRELDDINPKANLNLLDISNLTSLNNLFENTSFNGDISHWDTSNVITMRGTFTYTDSFNGDISKWNVSNVRNMENMFAVSVFNQDISNWDVSNVRNMNSMFFNSEFNQDISKWNTNKVRHMNSMFNNSKFNYDISNWDVSNVLKNDIFPDNDFDKAVYGWNLKEQFRPKGPTRDDKKAITL